MPSRFAIASASRIIAMLSSRVSGNWRRSTNVAWVSALIGLKLRFPQILSQISPRMSSVIGALNPALERLAEIASTRGVLLPSNSPRVNRFPSTTRTTPGATRFAAG